MNPDSYERQKEAFYSNYPKNGVALPENDSRGVIFDESPSTVENVKV